MALDDIFKGAEVEVKVPQMEKHKVLIVEDEEYLREFYEELLKSEGYDVFTASNGKDGLALCYQTIPHVILLDMMMPVLGGMEVLRELRKNEKTRDIPVIILTNAGNIENIENAKFQKVFKFLIKSNINPSEIITNTKEAILSINSPVR